MINNFFRDEILYLIAPLFASFDFIHPFYNRNAWKQNVLSEGNKQVTN